MRCLIFGSLPSGKGGMERIINTLLRCREQDVEFSALFFDFHGISGIDDSWIFGRHEIECPPTCFPRIIQEILIVRALANKVYEEGVDVVLCLDERACKLAVRMRRLARRKIVIGSWLHRSIHTFQKTAYLSGVDFHLAISEGIKKQLNDISEAPVFLLQNCVDVERVVLLKQQSFPTYLYIGRLELHGQKSLSDLFTAFSSVHEDAKLHIVGSGPDEVACKEFCEALGIEKRVVFHGWQSSPWKYISKNIGMVDALCLTSSYEGFPLVLIEGISQGVFCVSSDCETGPRDIITSDNGILYPTGNVDALRKAMLEAVSRGTTREKIIESSVKYGKEAYFQKLSKILENVLGSLK